MNTQEVLIKLREESGKTKSRICEETMMHRTTINNYERGIRIPNVNNFEDLLKAYGYRLEIVKI